MPSRRGEEEDDASAPPPNKPNLRRRRDDEGSNRRNGEGLNPRDDGRPALSGGTYASVGEDVASLKMPGRTNSSQAARPIWSREFSTGLISRPAPSHRDKPNLQTGSNTASGKPPLGRHQHYQQEGAMEHSRKPPVRLASRRRHLAENFPDDRAPPRPRIYTTEEFPQSASKQESSKLPFNLFQGSPATSASLSSIDKHFLTLSKLDDQEEERAGKHEGGHHHNQDVDNVPWQGTENPKPRPQNHWVSSAGDSPYNQNSRSQVSDAPSPQNELGDEDYFELLDLMEDISSLPAVANDVVDNYTDEQHFFHDNSWNVIRRWLQYHGQAETILPYLYITNEHGQNALHVACLKQPPHDVINKMIEALNQSGRLDILLASDNDGRTPLHQACRHSAPPDTLRELARWSATKLCSTDVSGLTPLHLALLGQFNDYPDLIHLLASTGACEVRGSSLEVLPLHYACCFGATEQTLEVLIDKYPESLREFDKEGRTCLHWAILSCTKAPESARTTVELLLDCDSGLVNLADGETPQPLEHLVGEVNKSKHMYRPEARQEAVKGCLTLLLDTKFMVDGKEFMLDPAATRELRVVPPWLFATAILNKKVQGVLDRKMKSRLPTVILMLDLYMQIMIMVSYKWNIEQSLDLRDPRSSQIIDNLPRSGRLLSGQGDVTLPFLDLSFLYIGAAYFLLMELIQVISLIWAKSLQAFLKGWVFDPTDWLDVCYISIIFIWATILRRGLISDVETFSGAAALSVGVLWIKFFTFLRTISFDFSVFVSGVFYVAGKLVPYMICLLCFLGAFTQIFYTIFFAHPDYGCVSDADEMPMREDQIYELQCFGKTDMLPFCYRWDSFLKVYTMFLGEVDERDFKDSVGATFFFAVFMLLMVIFLANVLIAIVTHYYKRVQDKRAERLFYTNRLMFLAEVDTIGKFPCFSLLKIAKIQPQGPLAGSNARETWQKLTDTMMMRHARSKSDNFSDTPENRRFNHRDDHFWNQLSNDASSARSDFVVAVMQFVRAACAFLGMSCWFVWGLITVGLAWPPQIREWFFSHPRREQSMAQKDEESQKKLEEEESRVEEEVKQIREEYYVELDVNRRKLADVKYEIKTEMLRLRLKTKELLAVLEQKRRESTTSQYSFA